MEKTTYDVRTARRESLPKCILKETKGTQKVETNRKTSYFHICIALIRSLALLQVATMIRSLPNVRVRRAPPGWYANIFEHYLLHKMSE